MRHVFKIYINLALGLLTSLSGLCLAGPRGGGRLAQGMDRSVTGPNVLVIVFDTLSAAHTSVDGYPRRTTPHLERFAERATVYHRHHSAGNFANPGTASLLTGAYPWSPGWRCALGLDERGGIRGLTH